ncbi:MAG: ATP-binding protein [Chitinophagales bacterium]
MFKVKPINVLLLCSFVALCTGILQYLKPDNSFYNYGLALVILMTVFLAKESYTWIFGGISIFLVVISAFYYHPASTAKEVAAEHSFTGIIIIFSMATIIYIKRLYISVQSDERQLNALFEHATEGIILTNQSGQIVLINPAAEKLFNYDKKDLVGKQIETLTPSRIHAEHVGYRKGFYHEPSNRAMGHGRELFAKTKDGKEFPVEVSLGYYRQGNEFYVIAFIVDITKRKKSEQELLNQKTALEKITEEMSKLNTELETKVEQRTLILREALQELERSQSELNEALSKERELNEIKSRFVSMASHEFRTPLSTVLSSSALIGKYTHTDEQDKRDKHIRRIKDSVKHLNNLLEDFLSLGKLEEGKVRAESAAFNVREFVEEVVDEMGSILKENQSIRHSVDGNPQFNSDKRLLKNILINLIGNASKFSGEGSSIWLDLKNNNHSLQLSVRDEGIGISNEDQQHLFSSFFRGNNVTNIEGTGLGLHIVKRYIDLLKGQIQLKSKLGEGTSVTITLPATKDLS